MGDRFQPQARSVGGGVGITELTQDVLAGPAPPGVQAATVVGLQNNPVDNAAPALGDVLTWDGAKWTPAAAAGGGGWQVAYSVDFGALAPQNIKVTGAGGTAVLDGKTWNTFNVASTASLDVVAGVGLVGQAAVGTSAGLWIPIVSLNAAANMADCDLCFMAHLARTEVGAVNPEQVLVAMCPAPCIGDLTVPSVYTMLYKDDNNAPIYPYLGWFTYGTPYYKASAAEEFVGSWQAMFGGANCNAYYDTVAAIPSSPASLKSCINAQIQRGVNNPTPLWSAGDPHVLLRWNSAGGTSKFAVKGLKILYR